MFFVTCLSCGIDADGIGAEKKGWDLGDTTLCPRCSIISKAFTTGKPQVSGPDFEMPETFDPDKHVPHVPIFEGNIEQLVRGPGKKVPILAAAFARHKKETVGFDRPEDGSEGRYLERRSQRPWLAHTFWWVVHNVLSHPLIGILPLNPFFKFHDWTSRKMHGE